MATAIRLAEPVTAGLRPFGPPRWGSAMICPPPTPGRGTWADIEVPRCGGRRSGRQMRPARMAKRFSPQPGAFKLVEDASQEGVSLKTAGGSWTVRFNRQGFPGGTVSVRRGAAPAFTASLANEVRANATPPGLAMSAKE